MQKLYLIFAFYAINCIIQPYAYCANNLIDTATVIKIAKQHHAYWTNKLALKPIISFNSSKYEWKVESSKHKHTNKGNCKHTNGCTQIKTVTLIIDDKTKKVKHKKKTKQLMPNYE